MTIRTVLCSPANPLSSTSQQSQPTAASAPEKRKRVRRWHRRGFTGCLTCRRRHVRCDEAAPSCKNCMRLGLDCDGTQGRMTFKVYGPSQGQHESSPEQCDLGLAVVKKQQPHSKAVKQEPRDDVETSFEGIVISPTTVVESAPIKYRFQEPIFPVGFVSLMSSSLDYVDGRYYTHFIDQVSSLLLIYDNSMNINPFRRDFPELARSSPSMASAMQALGALHLANTSQGQQRNGHFQKAIRKYGEVVKSLGDRYTQPNQQLQLTDFATCLLLALFEMMDSQHDNWAIHLKGAREIYRNLFFPNTADPTREAQRLAATNHPLRNFLISLLSFLDVAGACNTSEGTVVEGSYWKMCGGGWEYNLGTPSLSLDTATDSHLVELRQCWSSMMEIQAAISAFGNAKHGKWLPCEQQDAIYSDLYNRLVQWRASAPQCIQQLGDLQDDSLRYYQYPEVLEYAGCIEAYEKATIIFLQTVIAASRPDRQSGGPFLDMLASRILALIGKLAKDVGHLAVLWPLFTAGRVTRNETEQKFVRQTMIDCQRFGFKNVERGLEELERVWFKQRTFPEGWVDRMEDIRSPILLP